MPQLSDPQSAILTGHLGCAAPVSAAENAHLVTLTPQELAKTDLTKVDVRALFSAGSMTTLRETTFRGVGTPRLQHLMKKVANGFQGTSR